MISSSVPKTQYKEDAVTAHEKLIEKIMLTRLMDAGFTHLSLKSLNQCLSDSQIARGEQPKTIYTYTIADALLVTKQEIIDRNRRVLYQRLVDLGMNHLDMEELPPETATHLLPTLTKDKIRSLDVRVLGTLSPKALAVVAQIVFNLPITPRTNEEVAKITIAEFIDKISFTKLTELNHQTLNISFDKTRFMLLSLKFDYKDGLFLQDGSLKKMIEDLAMEYKLSKKTAEKICQIALEKKWIKPLYT